MDEQNYEEQEYVDPVLLDAGTPEVEADDVSPRVRTRAYYTNLTIAGAGLVVSTLVCPWIADAEIRALVAQTALGAASVSGTIAGWLGVKFRPTIQ